MNVLDSLMDDLDREQNINFGVDVLINGVEHRGIFDEEPDHFEGVDVMRRTLEVTTSDLLSEIENDSTVITLVSDNRTFKVFRHEIVDTQTVMELR